MAKHIRCLAELLQVHQGHSWFVEFFLEPPAGPCTRMGVTVAVDQAFCAIVQSFTLRKFNLLTLNPDGDTPANRILTNTQKNTAVDAEPTLKLQQSANEGGSNNNTGSVSGKPCYRYSNPQKDIMQHLLPEYKNHSSKRKQAFDDIYSKHLMSNASFAKPASMTAEEWKRTLIKWFDNNIKKSGQTVKRDVEAQLKDVSPKAKHVGTADKNTLIQNHIPHPANPPSTNQSDTLSWAKLCDLAKFFNELTSGDMHIKSGRMVFAGSWGMTEEEISKDWNKLSVDEQNKWEKHAAAECNIQHGIKIKVALVDKNRYEKEEAGDSTETRDREKTTE
ncbi:hypothetical protein BT96DRAFT_934943 [Gymnopus androsaceus JB14]|uniref:Uncharacterized protein n=1 Tax=Gymnopus androsaceus JB14 TaxID=1447944 RepID=A0A6A4I7U0_9AGAR|nr:hypothetical protein BT96DRAFT_934943 [Gymnopus androsaceus JB14]